MVHPTPLLFGLKILLFRIPWDYFRSQREILLQTFPGISDSQYASLKKDRHILFKLWARSNFLGVDLCLHKQIKILCHLSASRTAITLKSQTEGSTACQPRGLETFRARYNGIWNRYVNRWSIQGTVTEEGNEMMLEWGNVIMPSKMCSPKLILYCTVRAFMSNVLELFYISLVFHKMLSIYKNIIGRGMICT